MYVNTRQCENCKKLLKIYTNYNLQDLKLEQEIKYYCQTCGEFVESIFKDNNPTHVENLENMKNEQIK